MGFEPLRIPVAFDPAHLDSDALKVIRRLVQHGYEAYLVGGCVRDLLLGERPKDFDLATSAKPNEIRHLFRNCRIIGRRFRLAHILFSQGKVIEVATFRDNTESREAAPLLETEAEASEVEADPAPAPDRLIREDNTFGNAETDALRRDFTLNALFYDVEHQCVIDYVGGYADVQQKRLVCIGDPTIRFQEDPVRIIRGIKFAARLGLTIDDATRRAMIECHNEIAKSSKSRVTEEVFKILGAKGVFECFVELHRIGVLSFVLPFLVAGQEPSEDFWNYLRALEWGMRGTLPEGVNRVPAPPEFLHHPTRAILFGALIGPMLTEDLKLLAVGPSSHMLRTRLHQAIQSCALAMSNPRRDTFRFQQAIAAQERLWQGSQFRESKRRRRRLPSAKLAERAYFSEALQFMWLYGAAHHKWIALSDAEAPQRLPFWEAYESWAPWRHVPPGAAEYPPRQRDRGHAAQPRSDAAGSHETGVPAGKRRRRRGGRRRRQRFGRDRNSTSSIS